MKYCPKCGEQNPDEAKFCGKCGSTMTVSQFVNPDINSDDEVSSGLKTGIIVLSIFLPVIGIVMGIIYMNDSNISKKAVGKTWLYVGIGVIVAQCVIYALIMGAATSY